MRFVDDNRSDDTSGKRRMVSFQVGKQLLHGAAGAGFAAKEKNLIGAAQRVGYRVVEAFSLGLSLPVAFTVDVMQVSSQAIGIVGNDAVVHGFVEVSLVNPSHAMIDHDKDMNRINDGRPRGGVRVHGWSWSGRPRCSMSRAGR